ncbi:phospholipid carrier-dependent glycosyltransferase [Chloroflexota bacterium]
MSCCIPRRISLGYMLPFLVITRNHENAGLSIFGDNILGWRFFPIICGTLCILPFYLICRQLEMPRWATMSATFLLFLENHELCSGKYCHA